MLKFIGNGSAFNTQLGNNASFIKEGNTLFLIDCGSDIFQRLIKETILKDVTDIRVLITHAHPDHIGSLGDLIFYSFYSMGKMYEKNLTLYTPKDTNVTLIMDLMGVKLDYYHYVDLEEVTSIMTNDMVLHIEPIKVNHIKTLTCYGYVIEYNNSLIYYSGDSYEIPKEILNKQLNREFDYFYQDVSFLSYEGNPHMFIGDIEECIPLAYRDNVYLMHLDGAFNLREALEKGFNVTTVGFQIIK